MENGIYFLQNQKNVDFGGIVLVHHKISAVAVGGGPSAKRRVRRYVPGSSRRARPAPKRGHPAGARQGFKEVLRLVRRKENAAK